MLDGVAQHRASLEYTNGNTAHVNGTKKSSPATLAGTGRREAMVAAGSHGSASVDAAMCVEVGKEQEAPHASLPLCSKAPEAPHHPPPDLRDRLADIVHILLQAIGMLSADTPLVSITATTDGTTWGRGLRRAAGNHNSSSSSSSGEKSSASAGQRAGGGAAGKLEGIWSSETITSVMQDALNLIHMVITARKKNKLSLIHCHEIVQSLFRPMPSATGSRSEKKGDVATNEAAAVGCMADVLVRQLLIAGSDEALRKQTSEMLFEAIVMGWETERCLALKLPESQGFQQAPAPLQMGSVTRMLIESAIMWLPLAADASSDRDGAGDDTGAGDEGYGQLRGREVFEWAQEVIQVQNSPDFLLSTDDQLTLLQLILARLVGQPQTCSPSAPTSKRKASENKLTSRAVSKRGGGWVKASNAAAAGLLGLVDMLFTRLPTNAWLPLVVQYDIGNILFEKYLMAADPTGAPLLGWPDDKQGRDARKAGWLSLRQIASCLDGAAVNAKDHMSTDAAPGLEAASLAAGSIGGDGGSLSSLMALVSRTHHFVEYLPPPASRTEEGLEEMLVFDPEHNGLRHGQPALVGLKNRRNTCYINSMLQQLFVIPEFHKWLEYSTDKAAAAAPNEAAQHAAVVHGSAAGTGSNEDVENGGNKELSDRLQELFGYLRHSMQRFFDPGEFIKACKSISRQPPLLDKAHTQDDTMTFLESLMDVLTSVHGVARTDLFKVVEKDRRWVNESNEVRSITGREKEYLMLEIEDGIGDLESALRKHFSKELMTGDNRIWNESTQSKETVWKAPFLEETSLPEVLVVQLKRFKYNMTWDGRMEPHKLNTKVEFGNTLDLSSFVRKQKNDFDAFAVEHGAHVYQLQVC